MYKILSKVLLPLVVIASIASPITAFSMDKNLMVNATSANEKVYLSSELVSTIPTAVTTPTSTHTPIDDHGNNIGLATTLEIGTEMEAVAEIEGDYDCFKFTADTSGMYAFESMGIARVTADFYDNIECSLGNDFDTGIDKNFYHNVWIEANESCYIKTTSRNINVPFKVRVIALDDDHGHNYSSATELALDSEIAGKLNFTKDMDYFKFTPSASGPYMIESTGTTDVAGYLNGFGSSETDTCGYSKDISSSDKNFRFKYTLNKGETYYLHVFHNTTWDKDYEAEIIGTYGIKVSMLTDDYANTTQNATEVKLREVIQAVQESGKDFECFKFTPEISRMYSIESSGTTDTEVRISNSDMSLIDSDDNSGKDNNFYSAIWMNANEVYYIRTCSNDLDEAYKISINPLTDDYGDESDSATDLFLDNEVAGTINYVKDTDCFKFTPAITQQYIFESNGSANVDGTLLKCASNNEISICASNSDISTTDKNFRIVYTLKANQTYYLQVYLNNKDRDYETTGDYGVKVTLDEDDYGDNYDTAAEILVGEEKQVIQECKEDRDYFEFIPEISGMYSVESTGDGMTNVLIYNSAQQIIGKNSGDGINFNFYSAVYLSAYETYYLQAFMETIDTPYSPYILKLSLLTDDHGYDKSTATELVLDTEISGEINFTGDSDYFCFTPTTTQFYIIKSTGNTDVVGELVDCVKRHDISEDNRNFLIIYTLEANKTYYLKVTHVFKDLDYVPNTGAYGITITKMSDMTGDGDVNTDGSFDSIDFGYVRIYLLGYNKELTDKQLMAADVDNNGLVNSIDFALMRQVLLGIKNSFD